MSNIEHSDDAVIDFIDAWAQDYANDAWRELSGADQLREGRRIMAAAQPRGAVDLLREVDDGWDRMMETDDLDAMTAVVAKVRAYLHPGGQ